MDKRSLLFVVLTFLVIMVYSYINAPEITKEEIKEETTIEKETILPLKPREFTGVAKYLHDDRFLQELSTQRLHVNTEIQEYIIDIDRASIISCQLKNYWTTTEQSRYIELISQESEQNNLFPLDIVFFDEDIQKINVNTPFLPDISARDFHEKYPVLNKPVEIVFKKPLLEMVLTKRFTFYPDKYGINIEIEIEDHDGTKYAVIAGPGLLQDREDLKTKGRYAQPDNVIYLNRYKGKVEGIKQDKIDEEINILPNDTVFIALNDLYFAQVLSSYDKGTHPFYTNDLIIAYLFEGKNASLSLYLGPKNKQDLQSFDDAFGAILSFGFFSVIAIPLHNIINIFYGFIGNYGFAIIILTIGIKLIFFPITFKSYIQMRKMNKLNPMMKEIRKKFKDQPQKLNQEIQALYKKHGVNPIAGCLPMLLQFPILFALYRVLSIAIELRHQPFLWINDLAGPDPYLILPILMSTAMFVQQKLTPTSADPKQAKMMAIMMPAFFFIMFRNLQAGLVLYWFTSNLLIITEQFIISKAYSIDE